MGLGSDLNHGQNSKGEGENFLRWREKHATIEKIFLKCFLFRCLYPLMYLDKKRNKVFFFFVVAHYVLHQFFIHLA